MNDLLRWLLDLDTLGFGQGGVQFGFARPIPAWALALIAIVGASWAWITYRRLDGSRRWRTSLAMLRALLLLVIVLLIAGPRLIKPNETEEKDWVLVLVDRSASMTVRDAPSTAAAGFTRVTREEQLQGLLRASLPAWADVSRGRVVVWMGFDAGAYELKTPDPTNPDADTPAVPLDMLAERAPAGRRTSIGRAIDQALRRAAARPLSGVVILSDGRSIDDVGRAAMRRLEAERVPVFVVPLGSREALADVGIRRAEGPRVAFVNDPVPVEVELERVGGRPEQPAQVTVELIDDVTGAILTESKATFEPVPSPSDGGEPSTQTTRLTLLSKRADAGAARWSIRVRPDGTGTSVDDLVPENNTSELSLELVDRPLRVAYFDGYPRWEHRYLKSMLVRERSIEAAVLLLASGRRYLQEGSIVLDVLPTTPEEWKSFDVIVMGDVWPGVFTTEQLAQLREHISGGGAGLVFIGGEAAMPGEWRDTPLADLLPMVLSESSGLGARAGSGGGLPTWDEPVTMQATQIAERLGVLRLSDTPEMITTPGSKTPRPTWWPSRLADPATGWSRLWWAQQIEPSSLKPAAEVLAVAMPRTGGSTPAGANAESPVVVTMRYGAGRVLYVGTDEIWRWRYGRGEFYPERFWVQSIRFLGRERVARAGKPAILEVTPERAEVERAVRVGVTLLDQSLVDAAPAGVRVRITRVGEPGARASDAGEQRATSPPTEMTLTPETSARPGTPGASDVRATSRSLATTWIPTEPSAFRVEVIDSLLAGTALQAYVQVWLPDDELRRPQADHERLDQLAAATGGRTLAPGDLSDLASALPKRGVRLAGEPDVETLWDTPLALLLVMLLLTLEWVGRRLIRLV